MHEPKSPSDVNFFAVKNRHQGMDSQTKIETAIADSIRPLGSFTQPIAPRMSVIEWPIVNAVTIFKIRLSAGIVQTKPPQRQRSATRRPEEIVPEEKAGGPFLLRCD